MKTEMCTVSTLRIKQITLNKYLRKSLKTLDLNTQDRDRVSLILMNQKIKHRKREENFQFESLSYSKEAE